MKQLLFGVFENAQANDSGTSLWRHPENERIYFDELSYWTNIATICEEGGVDFLFLADAWGWSEIDGNRPAICDVESLDLPRLDPAIVVAALIGATDRLGLVVTGSTLVEAPYSFARRIATLDHLSNGRIGWNVVTTGTAETASLAFGQDMVSHDDRYDMADEFMELIYKLLENSWAKDAVKRDRDDQFTDPNKVRRIAHSGTHFRCSGYGNSHYSPQGTPVVFQAGSSPRGLKFAGRHGECIFLGGGTNTEVSNKVRAIRREVKNSGRDPEIDVKILCAASCIVGENEKDAEAKLRSILRYQNADVAAASYAMFTGIDLTAYPSETRIETLSTELSQTQLNRLSHLTVGEVLATWNENGVRPAPLVGTATQISTQLIENAKKTGVDGYLFLPTVQPSSTIEFVSEVLPLLKPKTDGERKTKKTLRQTLLESKSSYLVDCHPGARYRPGA